jgi:hypothetical protein
LHDSADAAAVGRENTVFLNVRAVHIHRGNHVVAAVGLLLPAGKAAQGSHRRQDHTKGIAARWSAASAPHDPDLAARPVRQRSLTPLPSVISSSARANSTHVTFQHVLKRAVRLQIIPYRGL